jgi:cytochrome c biogenesis protein
MSVSTSGLHLKTSHRILRELVELLSSMRFAIALLTIISIASIVGTVLKQNEPFNNYVNQFGPFWAELFQALSLPRVYSAWWFLLILAFLVVSTSLCLVRNTPKMMRDMRAWKENIREGSLRAFGHRHEFDAPLTRGETLARVQALLANRGFRTRLVEHPNGTLIAAKAGTTNKIGYILAHSAIVVICIGGLLDGDMLIRAQMWLGDKEPVRGNAVIAEIPPKHRLSAQNPGFRGNAFVPEGGTVSTAILNIGDGAMVQDLPFTITLKKFRVEYYSTGMPKLFASDVIVTEHATGKTREATIEVNKPLIVDDIAIYQSSFEDGGSRLAFAGYPMQGGAAKPFTIGGNVGGSTQLSGPDGARYTVEFSDFRLINVETVTDASGRPDARGVAVRPLNERLGEHFGAAAKADQDKSLRNVGPSVQYKLRDATGQAREFSNYMLPVQMDGASVFLAGVRDTPSEAFRYLRIPADEQGSVVDWMRLRAALHEPALRAEAARRFATMSMPGAGQEAVRAQLAESARRALDLFAGSDGPGTDGRNVGGFTSIAAFLEQSVPTAEQQKAADVLLKILNGSMWELWSIARAQANAQAPTQNERSAMFMQHAINALSDTGLYGAPVFLQLTEFDKIEASVFQLTRAPGKNIVYLGCLLLTLGVFAMFYIRERRLWVWVKDRQVDGSAVLMAMSTPRKTFDFEEEFVRMRTDIQLAAGVDAVADDAKQDK